MKPQSLVGCVLCTDETPPGTCTLVTSQTEQGAPLYCDREAAYVALAFHGRYAGICEDHREAFLEDGHLSGWKPEQLHPFNVGHELAQVRAELAQVRAELDGCVRA